MQDRTSRYPGRVKLVPVDEANGIYDMIRADEPTQAGDPLSKKTFLKDETAALFGLDSAATPDCVFSQIGQYNLHWWRVTDETGAETYAQSANRNRFPDFGTRDGVSYVYLGVPFQNSVDIRNTVVGSYVGNGEYGSANRSSITLPFVPKLLIVIPDKRVISQGLHINISTFEMMWVEGLSEETIGTSTLDGTEYKRFFALNDNEISWYATDDAASQMNTSGTKYCYFAIG